MAYEPEIEKLERRYQDDPARHFAQLAERYRKDGRLEDALTLLRGHLADRPNYVSGLVVLGRCLLDEHNDAEAREVFERVLAVDAEHIIALRALGEIAERAGEREGARAWFTRLLDVDPMNEDAQVALDRVASMGVSSGATEGGESGGEVSGAPPEPGGSQAASSAGAAEAEVPDFQAIPDDVAAAETLPIESFQQEATAAEAPPAAAAGRAEPREAGELPDLTVELPSDDFLPSVSRAGTGDVEQIGQVELASQLPEEEPILKPGSDADESEPFQFPTGEREIDLGPAPPSEETATAEAEAGTGTAAADETLPLQPFDDSLGWGAGERVSGQITQTDFAEARQAHEEGLEEAVHQLPGLEGADVQADDVAERTAPLEGLQAAELPTDVPPVEGLQVTSAMEEPAAEEQIGDRTGAGSETTPAAGVDTSQPAGPGAGDQPTPTVEPAAAASEGDRSKQERRASLLGLPIIEQGDEPDTPLVIEAEPEPVVTETMAELYARQGLVNEAREVYQQLLVMRPNDPTLIARIRELDVRTAGTHGRRTDAFSADATGGQSARAFLADILGAQPADGASAPVGEIATPGETATPPAAPSEPAVRDPMDVAFNEKHGAEAATADLGQPTQPAGDEVTLEELFGEMESSPPAAPSSPTEAPPTSGGRTPGGFSFDEFFGKAASPGSTQRGRDSLADDEGDEAFRDWLKSLKV